MDNTPTNPNPPNLPSVSNLSLSSNTSNLSSLPIPSPDPSPCRSIDHGEMEEEMMREMTASYSEISQCGSSIDEDRTERGSDSTYLNLQDYSLLEDDGKCSKEFFQTLEGTVEKEGDNLVFIAQDLENKLKLSSPSGDKSLLPSAGIVKSLIESNVLNNIETEANRIAHSVDMLIENLGSVLESMSAITVECLETYRDGVTKTCDIQDSNIKAMYQLMTKCEQLSISIQPIHKLAQQVKEVRRLIDLFDDACNS